MSLRPEPHLPTDEDRARAFKKLLAAPPMPVDDWPVMKKQMLEERYAKVMRILDTYD